MKIVSTVDVSVLASSRREERNLPLQSASPRFRSKKCGFLPAMMVILLLAPGAGSAATKPKLDRNCTVTIANRNVPVNADGTYVIPNVPTDIGLYRVGAICKNPDGTTTSGQSGFVTLVANGDTKFPKIVFGKVTPPPVAIQVSAPSTTLSTVGQATQLSVRRSGLNARLYVLARWHHQGIDRSYS